MALASVRVECALRISQSPCTLKQKHPLRPVPAIKGGVGAVGNIEELTTDDIDILGINKFDLLTISKSFSNPIRFC